METGLNDDDDDAARLYPRRESNLSLLREGGPVNGNTVEPKRTYKNDHQDTRIGRCLEEIRDNVLASAEWQMLTHEIYAHVQQQLEQNKVQFFSDLSQEEHRILIDEIEANLSSTSLYKSYQHELATQLDDVLERSVAPLVLEQGNRKSKVELIVEQASRAIVELLKTIPGDKGTVRLLLNQKLPAVLRSEIWKMYLNNAEARNLYEKRITARRMGTISNADAELTQKCKRVFEMKFPEISENGTLIMVAKTVLSYIHASSGASLDENAFLHIIPLVVVLGDGFGQVGTVVEAFEALRELDKARFLSHTADQRELGVRKRLVDQFHEDLQRFDQELYGFCMEKFDKYEGGPRSMASSSAEIGPSSISLARFFFAQIMEPLLDSLFVGFVSMDACLYIWDQCLLVGFDEMLPRFAVVLILLLRREIMTCETANGIILAVNTHGTVLTTDNLLRAMEQYYMPEIRQRLGIPLRGMSLFSQRIVRMKNDEDRLAAVLKQQQTLQHQILNGSNSIEIESEQQVKSRLSEKIRSQQEEINTKLERDIKSHQEDQARARLHGKSEENIGPKQRHDSENTQLQTNSENDDETDIEIPDIDAKCHRLADTIQRAMLMNESLQGSEEEKQEKIKSAILSKVSEFKDMDDTIPVLRVNLGNHKTGVFRALEGDEDEQCAREIVTKELERLNCDHSRLDALSKYLIRFSASKAGWKNRAQIRAEDDEIIEKLIETTIEAIRCLDEENG